ncbi:MAG: motility-associated protein, partial [Pseudomonadota bacterium]
MIGAIGILIVFVMIFGGYLAAGGKMGIILKSLPFEFTMIGGAAVGAFVISNDLAGIKHTLKDIGKVFKGPRWKPEDYRDLLCLLFELLRLRKQNPVALEEHIEEPGNSDIFNKYPRIAQD